MTSRALRIRRLRQRVAVGAAATFAGAFGAVAATGSMGTSSSAASTDETAQDGASAVSESVTTADVPSTSTTRQS